MVLLCYDDLLCLQCTKAVQLGIQPAVMQLEGQSRLFGHQTSYRLFEFNTELENSSTCVL